MEGFEIQETPESDEDNIKDKDSTFNRLERIQTLLKNNESLNELCKLLSS